MAQLRHEVDTIHEHGAELVVIGNGTAQFAAAFREELDLDTPLFIDVSCASYRALGMKRGVVRTLGRHMWMNMGRALWEGVRQMRIRVILRWWRQSVPALSPGIHGDAWQLGGVIVVLPDGRIPYRYLSAVAGDHPPVDQVVAALEAATEVRL